MAFFASKPDPLNEHARRLTAEIARLEAEIARLSRKPKASGVTSTMGSGRKRAPVESTTSVGRVVVPVARRDAVFPAALASGVPRRLRAGDREGAPVDGDGMAASGVTTDPHFNDLGLRKYDLLASWHRLLAHVKGSSSPNQRMVNLLAAGSIHGLRPLRYERRVARNRFLAFFVLLLGVLWGLVYLYLRQSGV